MENQNRIFRIQYNTYLFVYKMSIRSQNFRKHYHHEYQSFKSPRNSLAIRATPQSSVNYLINDFEITSKEPQILQNATKLRIERSDKQQQLKLKKQELKIYKGQQENIKKLFQGLKNTYVQQMDKSSSTKGLQSQTRNLFQKCFQEKLYQSHSIQEQYKKIKLVNNNIEQISSKAQIIGQRVQKLREQQGQLREKLRFFENLRVQINNQNNLQKQLVLETQRIYLEGQMERLTYKQKIVAYQIKSTQADTMRKRLAIKRLQLQQTKLNSAQDKINQIASIIQGKLQNVTKQVEVLKEQIKRQSQNKQINQKRLYDMRDFLAKLKSFDQVMNSQNYVAKVASKKSIQISQQTSENHNTGILQQRKMNIQIDNKQTLKNIRRVSNAGDRKCITEQII